MPTLSFLFNVKEETYNVIGTKMFLFNFNSFFILFHLISVFFFSFHLLKKTLIISRETFSNGVSLSPPPPSPSKKEKGKKKNAKNKKNKK